MSVCLKGSLPLIDIDELSLSQHSSASWLVDVMQDSDSGDSDSAPTATARRSALSSSSILMTGTPYSILRTSGNKSDYLRQERLNTKKRHSIRFSESVHVRNHLHHNQISNNEKIAAWFRKPEYKAIFKNNTQIIHTLEKAEKEAKRMMAKKKKEDKKKKKNQAKKCGDCSADNPEEIDDSIGMGIQRDEEQGFSARGLENETSKRRKSRDAIYLKAKYAVLSIQEDIDEHMFSMQEQHEEKLDKIMNKSKKKSKRRFSNKFKAAPEELNEETAETIRATLAAKREEFSVYAKAQYKNMIRLIAEKYGDICRQDAESAYQRGLQDERVAIAINSMEDDAENYASSTLSLILGSTEGSIDEKRRPSTTSTAATEGSSMSLYTEDYQELKGMKRATKMFLWKMKSTPTTVTNPQA